MCLLIFAPKGATPSKKRLRAAAKANPDGFGWAVRTKKGVYYHRTMDANEAIDSFHDFRANNMSGEALFHLRITTHGSTNIDNCHPFVVDENIVLGHNGMLPIKEQDGKSDTRIFATEWLPEMGVEMLDDPNEFAEIEKFAAGSKLVVLSENKRLAKPYYIVNERLGHWDKGVWWSNHSYDDSYWLSWARSTTSTIGRSLWTPNDDNDDELFDNAFHDEPYHGYQYDAAIRSYIRQIDGQREVWVCPVCGSDHTQDLENPDECCDICQSCFWCHNDITLCTCPPFNYY